MVETELLLEETNPYGSLAATVEDDRRTVYLYLWRPGAVDEEVPRAVWIANHLPAMEEDDTASMAQGIAPLMPRSGTRHPDGLGRLEPADLSFVWLEEGDGVALYRGSDLLAVLPPWSGYGDFAGYSREAAAETPLAWPLPPPGDPLYGRLEAARTHWRWIAQPASWLQVQQRCLGHLEARLGPHVRYWTQSGNDLPRIEVAAFQPQSAGSATVYATVGMSAQRMPQVELYHEDPVPFRCVELAAAADVNDEWIPEVLAALASYPWSAATWIGDGHTLAAGTEALPAPEGSLPVMLVLREPPACLHGSGLSTRMVPAPDLTGLRDHRGDPVTYLWLLPISARERELTISRGPSELIQKLARDGRGWIWRASQLAAL